jgi:hypothetical protein
MTKMEQTQVVFENRILGDFDILKNVVCFGAKKEELVQPAKLAKPAKPAKPDVIEDVDSEMSSNHNSDVEYSFTDAEDDLDADNMDVEDMDSEDAEIKSVITESYPMTDNEEDPMTDNEDTPDEFSAKVLDLISLGNVEVESNTAKRGLVRFVPINHKDGKNMYVVMNCMKNQIYLKEKVIKYPSGKKYTQYTARVKPDYDHVDNDGNSIAERPENPKKKFMVEVFNIIKRSLVNELKGYVKLPEFADQTEYHMSIRHKFDKFYSVLGYQNNVHSLKKGMLSHILRDCTQSYVIHLEGLRITDKKVFLMMRLCRTVVSNEIIDQIRYHDAKVMISKIINYKTTKSINKLRYGDRVNLQKKRYVKKADVMEKLEKHLTNARTFAV